MKAIEQYFHVVLFIMLYKVVLTFKSVDETLPFVLSGGTDYYAVEIVVNFSVSIKPHFMWCY